jgi:hypothetical protein
MVEERRSRGDVRDSMIDLKLAEYEKSGWPMSQYSFNNLGGEMLEAGADSEFSGRSRLSQVRIFKLTEG